METIQLKDPDIAPSEEVLKNVLGESYPVYEKLMGILTGNEYGLEPVWNYYKDGKAWLCKVIYRKKTVFWLSVWEKYFKTAFYFTEKTAAGIRALEINEGIKEDFSSMEPVGKLLPLVIHMKQEEQIHDLLMVVDYKKKLK